MHYYQFHIGDYRSATAHLSNDEDLAYRRLLDMYYDTENPIPLDVTWVAKRIRISNSVVQDVLNDMFEKKDDGFHQMRCDKELVVYKGFSDAGKRGAAKRWSKGGDSPPITPPMLTNNQEPVTNNQSKYICPPDGEPDEQANKKFPFCDHKKILSLYHECLPTLRNVEVWNETRAGYLRQRWREVCEELSKEKDITADDVFNWWNEFFRHVSKSKFLTGKINSSNGRAFVADLEWIIKPSNFAKIIEGKYHGNQ
jgi:hypothetical protein